MDKDQTIEDHYSHGNLFDTIKDGLAKTGVALDAVTIEDLAPVDEFHIGGRQATEEFLSQLNLLPDHRVLDIGSGIGGGSRFAATRYGARVSGVDLTAEFVETAKSLSAMVGISDRVSFHHGSALETPFHDASFDAAFMLHVGMNIPDKARLFAEAARVLKPGGTIGIYDIMALTDAPLTFPVPWSSVPETSAVASPATYKASLQDAGFEIVAERNRHAFAIDFSRKMRERIAAAGGPPPLGTHVAMGHTAPEKVANVTANLEAGRIAPVELIARRS